MSDSREDVKRQCRNLSEKKRRDQFNSLIKEIASMLPENNQKMDKSAVLKATISVLKSQRGRSAGGQSSSSACDIWNPSFVSNEELTHLMLEALDGFVLILSCTGKILYVSDSVASILSHLPGSLMGKNLADLLPEQERPILHQFLSEGSTGAKMDDASAKIKKDILDFSRFGIDEKTPSEESDFEGSQTIYLHVKRGDGLTENIIDNRYEKICLRGFMKYKMVDDLSLLVDDVSITKSDATLTCHDQGTSSREAEIVFLGMARVEYPKLLREIIVFEPNLSEFVSRHSLEWKFLYLDDRASSIVGYLSFEVLGTSGYDYYHVDDLDKIIQCHELLMTKGKCTSDYYRFLTKGHQWIWLKSEYYISYHQWNSKPEFVVSTNRVVSYGSMQAPGEGLNEDVASNYSNMSIEECKVKPSGSHKKVEITPDAKPLKEISSKYNKDDLSYPYHHKQSKCGNVPAKPKKAGSSSHSKKSVQSDSRLHRKSTWKKSKSQSHLHGRRHYPNRLSVDALTEDYIQTLCSDSAENYARHSREQKKVQQNEPHMNSYEEAPLCESREILENPHSLIQQQFAQHQIKENYYPQTQQQETFSVDICQSFYSSHLPKDYNIPHHYRAHSPSFQPNTFSLHPSNQPAIEYEPGNSSRDNNGSECDVHQIDSNYDFQHIMHSNCIQFDPNFQTVSQSSNESDTQIHQLNPCIFPSVISMQPVVAAPVIHSSYSPQIEAVSNIQHPVVIGYDHRTVVQEDLQRSYSEIQQRMIHEQEELQDINQQLAFYQNNNTNTPYMKPTSTPANALVQDSPVNSSTFQKQQQSGSDSLQCLQLYPATSGCPYDYYSDRASSVDNSNFEKDESTNFSTMNDLSPNTIHHQQVELQTNPMSNTTFPPENYNLPF